MTKGYIIHGNRRIQTVYKVNGHWYSKPDPHWNDMTWNSYFIHSNYWLAYKEAITKRRIWPYQYEKRTER